VQKSKRVSLVLSNPETRSCLIGGRPFSRPYESFLKGVAFHAERWLPVLRQQRRQDPVFLPKLRRPLRKIGPGLESTSASPMELATGTFIATTGTAFRLANGRLWGILRPCQLIAASRRPGHHRMCAHSCSPGTDNLIEAFIPRQGECGSSSGGENDQRERACDHRAVGRRNFAGNGAGPTSVRIGRGCYREFNGLGLGIGTA
jgi:hypothetical protein